MTEDDIQQIYQEFHVPKHVIAHMKAVHKVAKILAKNFTETGIQINQDLIEKAALLHDFMRVCDFMEFKPESFPQKVSSEDLKAWQKQRREYGEIGHAQAAASILMERGEKDLSRLVAKHDFLEIDKLENWDEKIIYYADKRVEGDKITTLKDRLSAGHKRNNSADLAFDQEHPIIKKIFNLEGEIKEALGSLPI